MISVGNKATAAAGAHRILDWKPAVRILLYLGGLFTIALGINLAIKSNLGVSPVSAFTLPLSQITGISLGTVTILTYVVFVLLQIGTLGKQFRAKNLLQAPFSVAFGFFVDFTGHLMKGFHVNGYPMQLAFTVMGILVCAVGAAVYIAMDVVPNAPEGLILSICETTGVPFSKMKMLGDCAFVALGIALSLIFMGRVTAIREGTVLSALITGKIIGIIAKRCKPLFQKVVPIKTKMPMVQPS